MDEQGKRKLTIVGSVLLGLALFGLLFFGVLLFTSSDNPLRGEIAYGLGDYLNSPGSVTFDLSSIDPRVTLVVDTSHIISGKSYHSFNYSYDQITLNVTNNGDHDLTASGGCSYFEKGNMVSYVPLSGEYPFLYLPAGQSDPFELVVPFTASSNTTANPEITLRPGLENSSRVIVCKVLRVAPYQAP